MLLNNRSFSRLFFISCAAAGISAGGTWVLSGILAKIFVRMQIASMLHVMGNGKFTELPDAAAVAAGEQIFSEFGIGAGMDPQMMEYFPQLRKMLFTAMLLCCLLMILIIFFAAVWEQLRVFCQLEQIRQDCTEIAELVKTAVPPRGEDFSCIRRVSDSVDLISKRLTAFNHSLMLEKESQKVFLTDFSHQLKTSLAVVRLNADLLLDTALPPAQQDQLIEEISMQLDGMESMVFSALRLAKINAGSVVYEKNTPDLAATCREAVMRLSPLLRKYSIALETRFPEGIRFFHDRVWLCEAITNLIKNAADHSECSRVSLELCGISGAVKLTISDNGRGIPQSEIPHLFDRFHKKDRGRGMDFGVGMEIARRVVESHDGSISVYSDAETGTSFEIIFLK